MSDQPSGMGRDVAYPVVYRDMMAKWHALLTGAGIASALAHELSLEAAEHLRGEFGGEKLYLPKGTRYERQRLKEAIFLRWNGKNTHELCREFDITETYLRKLYDEARREQAASRQPQLF